MTEELIGYISQAGTLEGSIESSGSLEGSIESTATMEGYFSSIIANYDGLYSYTPSEAVQTIPTQNTTVSKNITIEAIPSNYGRISYNGSTLTVY